jgi:hypothetical protein
MKKRYSVLISTVLSMLLGLSDAARAQQRPEDAVVAAYLRHMAQSGRPNPQIRYQPVVVRVQKNAAVVIGNTVAPKEAGLTNPHHSVYLVLEAGEWKIAEERASDSPIDPAAVYALVPPDDGLFRRSQSPWQSVAYAALNTRRFAPADLPWKMQAIQDESFLYVRFEAASVLPLPGAEIRKAEGARFPETGTPPGPPVMKISLMAPARKDFEFQAGSVIQTRATLDEGTKKYNNRYFIQYSLTVRSATQGTESGKEVFTRDTSDGFGKLVTVRDRYLEIEIPLQALGLSAAQRATIRLEEYNSLPLILPYQVVPFAASAVQPRVSPR